MKESTCKKLSGRDTLIDDLVHRYSHRIAADQVTFIYGNHGNGKAYVLYETINRLTKHHKKINIYMPEEDKFFLYGNSNSLFSDNISSSISIPTQWGVNIGITASKHSNTSQLNQIYNVLKGRFTCDLLICLPAYSDLNSKIKLFVKILIANYIQLEKTFKHKIFFLITDTDTNCFEDFMGSSSIVRIHLEDYDSDDIYDYLVKKHSLEFVKENIKSKLDEIKQICSSNLKLVDFLYIDFLEKDLEYFRALDSVVKYRLSQLKKEGLKINITEHDMEDIILTSSISLKNFGGQEIAKITNKQVDSVCKSLHLAKEQQILKIDTSNFYEFICGEVQKEFRKELESRNKERYLDYYNYYSTYEQDQYYLRAYYLMMYHVHMQDNSFALIMLAYSEAINFSNTSQIKKIDAELCKASDKFKEDYEIIKKFYCLLECETSNYNDVYDAYKLSMKDYYELPLKAELTRTYFYYVYKNHAPYDIKIKHTLNQLIQYANEELCLDMMNYPIEMVKIDETAIRLRIIYDIAPYVLDCLNDIKKFQQLYDLSRCLAEKKLISKSNKGIARYMENVFNRKAFLFVNQTQCDIYYQKAKKYFLDNQIWDEYCITLICEAGTNIVIQRYDDAIGGCQKAKKTANEKSIVIPQFQKLMNNVYIADFLRYEQSHSPQKCFFYANKIAKKLRKQLLRTPCATEYVIVTNICSLYLYSGNLTEYCKYKKYIEKLMGCADVSNIVDENIDDFYRYYFAWFELYRNIIEKNWNTAKKISQSLQGFVPALFQKQEVFWDKKLLAVEDIIDKKIQVDGHGFCNNLVELSRRASELATFFCRGLMLSDLQYTSYD